MIHKSFDNAHQSKPQHKHNQLGWFWSTEETKPVFLADRAYGSNLPFASEYFMDEESKSGGFCIGPDSEATEEDWEKRKTFLKEMVLTDLRLERDGADRPQTGSRLPPVTVRLCNGLFESGQ